MSDKTIEEQVREETRAQLEAALEGLDPSTLSEGSAEHFRAIANAETDEEREAAIADAVLAGESEAVIKAAAGGTPIIDLLEDEDEDEDEGTITPYANVPVQGAVTLNLLMTVQNPGTLSSALDSFNASLGRFGTDGFYIVARDQAGNEWVVNSGYLVAEDDFGDDEDDEDDE